VAGSATEAELSLESREGSPAAAHSSAQEAYLEVYFVVGVLIAALSLWWFGAFDREPTPEEVRRPYDRQRR
jgi:hypothetical protein